MSEGTPAKRSTWRRFLLDLAVPPAGPRFRFFSEWLVPAGALALVTVLVRATGFDLAAQQWIHRIGGGTWSVGRHPFWDGLYHWGTVPAFAVVYASLGAIALGWRWAGLGLWRRAFAYLVLCGFVGPGLVTNVLLKELWGRPRPRELVEFGGRSEFEPVLVFNPASEGLSFPCGHATMGFYFFALYFLLRGHRPGFAAAASFGSLAFGGLIGLARMVQGGHFFSDVVWAAGVCWFVSLGLFHAMRLDRSLVPRGRAPGRPLPVWAKAGFTALALALLAAFLLATPYGEKVTYSIAIKEVEGKPLWVRITVLEGDVRIEPGDRFRIAAEASGHGFPTSKISRFFEERPGENAVNVLYAERRSGWLHELNASLRVAVPWHRLRRLRLDTGQADVHIRLSGAPGGTVVELLGGSGKVTVDGGRRRLAWKPEGDPRVQDGTAGGGRGTASGPPDSRCRFELGPDFRGTVEVVAPPVP